MKNQILKLSLILISSLMIFTNCKKDDKNQATDDLSNYFSINGARVVNSELKSGSGNAEINSIGGINYALPGGSNTIKFSTTETTQKVLVSVKGLKNYYELEGTDFSNLRTTDFWYLFSILINSDLSKAFTMLIALVDESGNIGAIREIPVSFQVAGTGVFQVNVSWDNPNDIDLLLQEPDGNVIYYNNEGDTTEGFLDVDSNPGCEIDGINSENITYKEKAYLQNGIYKVRVNLYDACEVTSTTHYTVTARINGELVSIPGYTNPYSGTFQPADEDDDSGSSAGTEVMRINVNTSNLRAGNTVRLFNFNFSDKSKMEKANQISNATKK